MDLVSVVLTGRLQVRNGGLLHPGETAGLSAEEAEELVQRGIAKYPEPPACTEPAQDVKAPVRPDVDKMVKGNRSTKK